MGHNIIFSDFLFGATYNYYYRIVPIWIYIDSYGCKDKLLSISIDIIFYMFRVNSIISESLL